MESIGRYELHEQLGHGGMGIVYRAFDTLLQRVVAVKLISRSIESTPELRERFFREARSAAQLAHKNIITIHDLGEYNGQPYLAMEYLLGQDLQRRLSSPEKMSLLHKVDVAIECCEGLEHAHAHGVVHRDIKPANIFITSSGTVKILDFGLARLITSELTTKSNMLMGTLNYMAPEQVRGERADHRTDIFSLGVVLYEVLGGRKAFEGDSFASTLYKILQSVPEPLRNLDATLPEGLIAIVERALAKPRDERYQLMGDLRHDLTLFRQYLVDSSGDTSRPLTPATVVRRPPSGPPMRPDWQPPPPTETPEERPLSSPSTPAFATPRRRVVAIVLSLGIVAVTAAGIWMAIERGRSRSAVQSGAAPSIPPTANPGAAIAALTQAERAFEAQDYGGAQRYAEEVLKTMPDNAAARDVRDRSRDAVERIDRGLRSARQAADAGRHEEAARAAGEVLTVASGNEEAKRIIEQAAARSKGRSADTARRRMLSAKSAARGADAASLARDSYESARRAEDEAQRLSRAGQLDEATARFYEAAGLYGSAELAARREAAANAGSRSRGAPPPAVPTPSGAPVSGEDVRQAPPAPGLPAPPAGIPAPPLENPVPAPAPAEPTSSSQEQIAELIDRYKTALESRSLDALQRVWPSLAGVQQEAIRSEFSHASRIRVEIVNPDISVSGSTGVVRFLRRYELLTVDGQRLHTETRTTMDIRRSGAGWFIERIRFEPAR